MTIMGTHNDLALAFGILGNIISFLVFLAPLPTFYRIYKKKSTEGFQSLPYLVALFSCVLWLYYASLKTDVVLLLTINSVGCVIEIIYIFMYTIYAPREARYLTVKLFMVMNVGSFALILFATQFALHGSLRVKVLGWICVAISVCVFAAPLSIVAQVIRTKSVEFMPFNLSLFLTLSAIMWFAYGAFIKDICIAIPNVLGFALGIVQMLLYAIYRNGGGEERVNGGNKEHALEPMRNVVVVSPLALGAREVFPISVVDDVKEEGKKDDDNGAQGKEKSVQDIVFECPV